MIEQFGSLYGALEECAISENALSDAGFDGEWMAIATSIAIDIEHKTVHEYEGEYYLL